MSKIQKLKLKNGNGSPIAKYSFYLSIDDDARIIPGHIAEEIYKIHRNRPGIKLYTELELYEVSSHTE